MERTESEKYNKEKNEKIKNKTENLVLKQNLEKNAFRQKIDVEYEIMKKGKDDEMAKIIMKYKNRKMDLDLQQKQEKLLTENENLSKASKILFFYCLENASVRLSQTQKNFQKSSPPKFKLFPAELRMKEFAKSMKKPQDDINSVKYISQINNSNYSEKDGNEKEKERENILKSNYEKKTEKQSDDISNNNMEQNAQNYEIDHNELVDDQDQEISNNNEEENNDHHYEHNDHHDEYNQKEDSNVGESFH